MKELLSQKGLQFVDRDVSQEAQALEELTALGHMTTPIVRIDGETVIGFDRKKLERLLG